MSANSNTNQLTKEEFEKLFSDEITVKEKKVLTEKVLDRIQNIVEKTAKLFNFKVEWYDFDNGDADAEIDGYFDVDRYQNVIDFEGRFLVDDKTKENYFDSSYVIESKDFHLNGYRFSIPSDWLHENVDEKLLETFNNIQNDWKSKQEKAEAKRASAKARALKAPEIMASIRSKLTPEELSYITFNYRKTRKGNYTKNY
jgi:hypothetical protein